MSSSSLERHYGRVNQLHAHQNEAMKRIEWWHALILPTMTAFFFAFFACSIAIYAVFFVRAAFDTDPNHRNSTDPLPPVSSPDSRQPTPLISTPSFARDPVACHCICNCSDENSSEAPPTSPTYPSPADAPLRVCKCHCACPLYASTCPVSPPTNVQSEILDRQTHLAVGLVGAAFAWIVAFHIVVVAPGLSYLYFREKKASEELRHAQSVLATLMAKADARTSWDCAEATWKAIRELTSVVMRIADEGGE